MLTEYLYQKELAYFHTPSAVLRNHVEDLLDYYCSEVDDSTDRPKDLNNTSRPDTSVLSSSLHEERQENQEEVTQHNESESEEMSWFAHDFILEEIILRYGTGKNYNVMSEG